nr:four-carbon acid sugar kinase family protein [Klebsiella pneumoniae]
MLRGAATFVHWQLKKIDSTLRGNPGGELEAMMAAQGCRMAVVAPAYPAAGRHTGTGAAMCMVCPRSDRICQRSENAGEPGGD